MARAELLLLHGELDVRRGDRLAHGFGAMADHHDETRGLERASGVDDMSEERPAGQGMEHLGKRGPHALAGACRQNHDVHGVGNQTSFEADDSIMQAYSEKGRWRGLDAVLKYAETL